MAGFLPKDVRRAPGTSPMPLETGGGCDLTIQTDLVGVRSEVSSRLHATMLLEVMLAHHGSATSVVCVAGNDQVVGTLAAFRGLAQLVACLKEGRSYLAVVLSASPSHCTVLVAPA